MSWTQDIRAARLAWRKHAEGLNTLRQMAEQRPAAAAFAFHLAAEELQRQALVELYSFGVLSPQARYAQQLERVEDHATEARIEALFYETYYHDRERYEELAAQGTFDLPKRKVDQIREGPSINFDEEMGATLAATQHETYQIARYWMDIVGERSRAAGQGFYGPAVCDVFLDASEQLPVIWAGKIQEEWGGDQRTRDRAMASLSGWVVARLSLNVNPRLKAALDNVQGSSPFEQFLQGIGAATAIEWASLERGEPLSVLVTRVALRLEKEGSEAIKLNRWGKLAAKGSGDGLGTDERDLEEFRLREELRAVRNAAKLSKQEHDVLDLALGEQSNNAIADQLGITLDSVKTVKKRAYKKLRNAASQ
jgi:DNA-binding CsgD family transcriptional regulator